MPENRSTKRLHACTGDGLLYTETCKRTYTRQSDTLIKPVPPSPELSPLAQNLMNQSGPSIDILRAETDVPKTDIEYIQQFKDSENKMDCKECFEGKRRGFFLALTFPVQA